MKRGVSKNRQLQRTWVGAVAVVATAWTSLLLVVLSFAAAIELPSQLHATQKATIQKHDHLADNLLRKADNPGITPKIAAK